ncbi:phosphonate C-P lyase system protein PhnH [Rhodobacteraceae bacterium M382]|nr:phosphonate C-P lyase system protein PhnH [Rhodobacteraceae bacterium M382]
MLDQSLQGGFDNPPVQSATAFRAALSVMARPGNIETIQGAQAPAPMSRAAATLLLTLCDQDTRLFLADGFDTPDIRNWVAFHIGAPIVEPDSAQFAVGRWSGLPLPLLPIGTPEYPDRSATVIVEVEHLNQQGARLTGPGIREAANLSLPETAAFVANRALFPLGLDFYFTAGSSLAALPRSTRVEER